ncbi:DUF3147 family protein [Patescibacteria group bacterium]|nr:DUF3147 family protein [Patescibacteria group bacterium]MBU1683529.1 DUF3147 family protein [Patescibacteria group bacterium]
MDNLFLIQLISSFLVGGSLIAFLSFIAEKASEKVAGIIITLPSTIVISFFFIGWTLSPEKIAEIAPIVPIVGGATMIFATTYLYLSKIKLKKPYSIALCLIGSLFIWFAFAIPIGLLKISNLAISLTGYIILLSIAYYFLTIRPKKKSTHVILKYSTGQKISRAIFVGFIIALTVFLAKTLGAFWGGVFSAFPAVFLSTLVILHWHYDSSFLFKIWKTSPLGSIMFIVYPLTAMHTFPAFGIVLGTIISYLISMVIFLLITKVQTKKNTY